MMEFERLKRRNQDLLLIETIKRVGPSNYSLLARLTGLNPETVRYKISKQLGKFGLGLTVNIDYGELGFTLGLLKVKSNSSTGKSWFDHAHYLMLLSKVAGTDNYVCLYGIPYRFKKKYAESFEKMKADGLIQEFELTELNWTRYPPFRSELYNFDTKNWNVDWKRIEASASEAGVSSFSVNRDPKVDDVDIKILKYLKEDPTYDLAKIGKAIDVNPRTVRYHHNEHVMKSKLILGNNIRWTRPLQQGRSGEIMQIIADFKGLDQEQLVPVRKLFNKLPFTWLEGGTEHNEYLALMDVPILSFHECLGFIETHLGAVRSKMNLIILDSSKTQSMGVPDEMFDKRLGWRLFEASDSGTPSDDEKDSRQVVEGNRDPRQ